MGTNSKRGTAPLILPAGRKDALSEAMAKGLGQAAETLTDLLNLPVLLKAPEVKAMSASELIRFFAEEGTEVGVTIRQRFSGRLSGAAAIAFSPKDSLFLIRTLVGIQHKLNHLSAADQTALAEMGNVILNAAVAVLADWWGEPVRMHLPDVALIRNGVDAVREILDAETGAYHALVLRIPLSIGGADPIVYLILLMPEAGMKRLFATARR